MNQVKANEAFWGICPECQGLGKKSRGLSKKAKHHYQELCDQFAKTNGEGTVPVRPKAHLHTCVPCNGSGLIASSHRPIADVDRLPHIAIIGGGIGGTALAVACLHRGIPFTLYERDDHFNARSQGYGLTLQQASKVIKGLGILNLKDKVVSTKHVVHTTEGQVVGEWGLRKWMPSVDKKTDKNTNIHISRQSLRQELLAQLKESEAVQWGHQLIDFKECENHQLDLCFQVNDNVKRVKADLIVGADGIRSSVRRLLIGEDIAPLRYLDCMVILGICPLQALEGVTDTDLLDSATVFQTANGNERIYMMPYTSDSIMWQLSFPITEKEAQVLSGLGPKALKEEARRRTQWHDPIPQIVTATMETQISGYPVYDRELLELGLLSKKDPVTLIGDAAHPMSPFKGQGANQALLDALMLARGIYKACKSLSQWKKNGLRASVLSEFESEMYQRSAVKVNDSAEAAKFLHSEIVLDRRDEPRGSKSFSTQ